MSLPAFWNELEFFKPHEFRSPERMDETFMRMLDEARRQAGIAFIITSSYRPGDPLSHGEGLAVDIRAHGNAIRERIRRGAERAGFRRFGIYNRHIHLDNDLSLPLGIWGGTSE